MVLITLIMGQAKEDLDNIKEMMAEMNERLSLAEEKLAKTESELAATKNELAKAVSDQAAPPYIHECGSHYDCLPASYGTIPFTSLLYSSTNTEGGGLNITTGVFTAPWGGSYTVS